MSSRLKKLVVIFMSVTMLTGIVPTSVSAASAKAPEQSSSSVASLEKSLKSSISLPSLKITSDHPAIAASALDSAKLLGQTNENQVPAVSFKAMADVATTDTPTQYNLNGSILNNTAALTSSSSQNYYTFSVPNNRYMVLGLVSTNANYYVQLYQYQTSTSKYAATNVIFTAGKIYTLSTLPAGNYLLAVFSTGTVGDNYTIVMNASAPASPSVIYYASFAKMICGYPNSLYVNDSAIFSGNAENGTALDWRKSEDNKYGNYDEGLDQFIDNVKIDTSKQILHVSYSSRHASSSNALLIPIGVGTIWTFQHIYLDSGKITSHTFTDIYNHNTPMTLSADDLATYPSYLVFDLDTCKSVDLYSALNYHIGYQKDTPTVTPF